MIIYVEKNAEKKQRDEAKSDILIFALNYRSIVIKR